MEEDKPEEKLKLKEQGMDEHESKETPAEEAREEECKTCGKKGAECKCKKKGTEGGENPEEDTASATDANSSTTPGAVTQTAQHVLTPSSVAGTGREASAASLSGQGPADVHYGKSASVDVTKSPLFMAMKTEVNEMSKQLFQLQKGMKERLDALEKSFAARTANLEKTAKKVEEFYRQPLYKSIHENPDIVKSAGVTQKIEEGKMRFVQ